MILLDHRACPYGTMFDDDSDGCVEADETCPDAMIPGEEGKIH